MTTWENFVSRRNLNVELFLKKNHLETKEDFIQYIVSHGISPPSDEWLDSNFPNQISEESLQEVEQTQTFDNLEKKQLTNSRSQNKASKNKLH